MFMVNNFSLDLLPVVGFSHFKTLWKDIYDEYDECIFTVQVYSDRVINDLSINYQPFDRVISVLSVNYHPSVE